MSMIRSLMVCVALAAMLVISGCASVPMASKDADAKAKQFATQTDKAAVYIYRDEGFGAAVKMSVLIDGVAVGATAAHSYIYKELSPGQHVIVSKAENETSLAIDVKAGQVYFVWQEVKLGFGSARSALHLVDEAKGRAGVQKCTLVESP